MSSIDSEKILETRAKKLAEPVKSERNVALVHYLKFRLGEKECFGIPYQYIDEVIKSRKITSVPSSPDFISGVFNWRGEILAVLNLHTFLKIQLEKKETISWIVVVLFEDKRIGIQCDEIFGDDYFNMEELKPPFKTRKIEKINFIKGIYQGEVTILDVQSILTDTSILVSNEQGRG